MNYQNDYWADEMLEPLPKPYIINDYPYVILYKSDLKDIYRAFNSVFKKSVSASLETDTKKYPIEKIEDIDDYGIKYADGKVRFTEFHITGSDELIGIATLTFTDNKICIDLSDEDSITLDGLEGRINRLINSRRSFYNFIDSAWITVPIIISSIALYFVLAIYQTIILKSFQTTDAATDVIVSFLFSLATWLAYMYIVKKTKKTIIKITDKTTVLDIINKNREKIIVEVVKSGVILALGLFLRPVVDAIFHL